MPVSAIVRRALAHGGSPHATTLVAAVRARLSSGG